MLIVTTLLAALFALAPCAAAVNIETVSVRNAGNVGQLQSEGTFGAVGYEYRIGTYEVTNLQYAEFLNAKAALGDPLGLYSPGMGVDAIGGISRTGVGTMANPFVYAIKAAMHHKPVNFVSWYDAARFTNWLNNGQGNGDTETGAYTLLGNTPVPSNGIDVARNAGSGWFLPSEDEWYKAAYYDPGLASGAGGYWEYPTRSNTAPTMAIASSMGNITNPGNNIANYNRGADWNNQNGNVTTVGGAGTLSASHYGTSDQGGNVLEWNDTIVNPFSFSRGLRGGSFRDDATLLLASNRPTFFSPTNENSDIGFRVVFVPEPSAMVLATVGAAALGFQAVRRRRATRGLAVSRSEMLIAR